VIITKPIKTKIQRIIKICISVFLVLSSIIGIQLLYAVFTGKPNQYIIGFWITVAYVFWVAVLSAAILLSAYLKIATLGKQ
jgi:hypothetical protein